MKPKRYILDFDKHYPEYDPRLWRAELQLVKDIQPDGFIFGGDQLNFQCISHHDKDKPRLKPRGGYANDMDGFVDDILDPLDELLGKHTDKRWIMGNHEDWLQDLYDEQPELEGALDIEKFLQLEKFGWKVVPLGQTTTLGKLQVLHGESFNGQYAAKKLVETYCQSAVMGHLHTLQAYTKTAPIGKKKWCGWVIPTSGITNHRYAKNRPNSGLQGFAIVELWGSNFNLFPIVVVGGKFSYAGKLYGR